MELEKGDVESEKDSDMELEEDDMESEKECLCEELDEILDGTSKRTSSRVPNAQSCPWLIFSHGRSNSIHTFYSIADNRILKRKLPYFSGCRVRANYDGWTVMTGEISEDGDSRKCFLLNLTSMKTILLPDLENIRYNECFLSSSPLKPNCVVAFISLMTDDDDDDDGDGGYSGSRIKLWRQNQENWVEVVTKECLSDLITCDGKIYGMHGNFGYIFTVDIHNNDVQVGNHINTPCPTLKGSIKNIDYLLESCGDVFLIRKFKLGHGKRVRTVQVYKLMQDKKTLEMDWIRLTNIGDRAFFIHNDLTGFSCSATQAGLKGNSIYFTGSRKDTHIYRYSLLENRFYRSLPCPDVVNGLVQICWLRIH